MAEINNKIAVIWFRDDLRIRDNQALTAAVTAANEEKIPLVALYLFDEESPNLRPLGAAQKTWLHRSLLKLKADLSKLNIPLLFESGAASKEIPKFCEQHNATHMFWNRRYSDAGIVIDTALKADLNNSAISAQSFAGFLIHEPTQIKTGKGAPYRVYTPFWRNFSSKFEPSTPLPAPNALDKTLQANVLSLQSKQILENWNLLPKTPNWAASWDSLWTPGETGAHDRLGEFLDHAINHYKVGRDLPAKPYTSKISPHLRFGEITPNQIWYALAFHQENIEPTSYETYQKELVWREFAYHLLYHWPNLHQTNFNKRFDHFPWEENNEWLERWQRGETGYPIVDAGMRELWQTGWMHNRVRMVVASFLVKHLLIDWRHGERWFWDCLLDADPASNPVSWQWVAGCGADASPYFRIFNPYTQAQKFDKDAEYIKHYVVELKNKSAKEILKQPAKQQVGQMHFEEKADTQYCAPIVDHDTARKYALEALKTLPSNEA